MHGTAVGVQNRDIAEIHYYFQVIQFKLKVDEMTARFTWEKHHYKSNKCV